jgi:Ca2+-binding EF-hand superfamily protein
MFFFFKHLFFRFTEPESINFVHNRQMERKTPNKILEVNMKKLLTILLALSFIGFLNADPDKKGRGKGHKGKHNHFEKMDTDKDGKVTKAEWTAKHEAKFAKADANNDGVVTLEELKSLHKDKKHNDKKNKKGDRKERRFNRMDVNKDGKIDKEEWLKKDSDMFSKIDANADGSITKEEMESFHKNTKGKHKGKKKKSND